MKRIRLLLTDLIAQGDVGAAPGSSSPSNAPATTGQHAFLLEALLKAALWVGWSAEPRAEEAGALLAELLEHTERLMTSAITFAGVVLTVVHSVLSHVPLPSLPPGINARIIAAAVGIGSPSNILKAIKETAPSLPSLAPPTFNTAPHPTTPGAVALLVTETLNIVLARAVVPVTEVDQAAFASEIDRLSPDLEPMASPVWKSQTKALLADPCVDAGIESLPNGKSALDSAAELAHLWWSELMEPEVTTGYLSGANGNVGHPESDDEVYLTVAVLHLLNLLGLHCESEVGDQIARLKHILSENSTVGDARVLQAAFICLAIVVRNHPELGTSLTHHLRRLLMTPLPALEGEFSAPGNEMSPTLCAGSTCLAMCIEMSSNDDAISSTLYSLLGVLNHGSTIAPGAMSVRSSPLEASNYSKSFTSGKRTEEQRQLVNTAAVEIASRLALDTGRPDIIHLATSMLLQRLRGVDIATESAIVSSLVPLALAGNDEDLVEVYHSFSQISRSSNPEDPRMSSNAVLAAQTRLAKGLGNRLDVADGYLTELLVLFADKGTQTQMVSMVGSGSKKDSHREKYSALRTDNDKRASDLKAGLAALLIPISELLSHPDYHPNWDASSEVVTLFRNLWLTCVAFGFSGRAGRSNLSEHEEHALANIAEKTPALVQEHATDFVGSELEYNTVLRKDFANSIQNRMRQTLTEILPSHKFTSDIRNMSTPQVTMLIAINDLEEMRTVRFAPSVILDYFSNESINKSAMSGPLNGIAARLSSVFLKCVSQRVVEHHMPHTVSIEVRKVLIACTHRIRRVREVALQQAKQIIETFSALMCEREVVFTLLEMLTLMRRSCEMQYTDEYSPIHEFKSDKMDLTLILTDDYSVRNEISTQLYNVAQRWLTLAISRAPLEVQSTLQSYLNESRDVLLIDSVEMGAGVALHYSKAISRLDRQETIMPTIGGWQSDCSNLVASQFAAKNYFDGELSGARHILGQGLSSLQKHSPAITSDIELQAFKQQMADAVLKVHTKDALNVRDIRRLLLRAVSVLIASTHLDADILHCLVELPMAVFTPLAIAAGVDAWTWLVRERPEAEIALMGEISAGWLNTVKEGKGLFSSSMK